MSELNEAKIRDLAYQLWERDGSPDGKDNEYWHAAQELLAAEGEAVDPEDPVSELPIPALVTPTLVK